MGEFGRGSFGERMVMVCQVCMNAHHEGQKEVYIQDKRTGAYRRGICPLCVCLDCVQMHDDPIRAKVRPLMMGQTIASQYHLTVDEHIPGQAPRKRNITIKAPGPLNVQEAMSQIGNVLGLNGPTPPPVHALPTVGCRCGKNAVSKCIRCDDPLCMKCLKVHDC